MQVLQPQGEIFSSHGSSVSSAFSYNNEKAMTGLDLTNGSDTIVNAIKLISNWCVRCLLYQNDMITNLCLIDCRLWSEYSGLDICQFDLNMIQYL